MTYNSYDALVQNTTFELNNKPDDVTKKPESKPEKINFFIHSQNNF
jgi:hypothetical protein